MITLKHAARTPQETKNNWVKAKWDMYTQGNHFGFKWLKFFQTIYFAIYFWKIILFSDQNPDPHLVPDITSAIYDFKKSEENNHVGEVEPE